MGHGRVGWCPGEQGAVMSNMWVMHCYGKRRVVQGGATKRNSTSRYYSAVTIKPPSFSQPHLLISPLLPSTTSPFLPPRPTCSPMLFLRICLRTCRRYSTRGSCCPRHTSTSHALRTVMRNWGLQHHVEDWPMISSPSDMEGAGKGRGQARGRGWRGENKGEETEDIAE